MTRTTSPLPALLIAVCLAGCQDADGDGFAGGRDCDDADPRVFRGAAEVCDGLDNDCDGQVDEEVAIVAYLDRDGDGFGDPGRSRRVCAMPDDGVDNGEDCDDADPSAYPGGSERCDLADNDCDGEVDEDVGQPWWPDADGDGWGAGSPVVACAPPEAHAGNADDCDDADPVQGGPGAEERCDGRDNDCDGDIDEGLPVGPWPADGDGDGHGDAVRTVAACGPGAPGAAALRDDCDDADAAVSPSRPERTGGGDDDCDGFVDEIVVAAGADVQAAVDAASEGAVVQLDPGLHQGPVDLRGRALTFAGASCDATTLYLDQPGTPVLADGGEVVALTIAGGSEHGVVVSGDVTLSRVCVRGNSTLDSGGGVHVEAGTLTLTDSVIADNFAAVDAGGLHLLAGTTALVVRTQFLDNQALIRGGGAYARGAALNLRNTVFAGNRATYDGGAAGVATTQAGPATLTARFCTFVGNEIPYDFARTGTDSAQGAALYSSGATLDVSDSVFAFNGPAIEVASHNTASTETYVRVALFDSGAWDTWRGDIPGAVRRAPDFVGFEATAPGASWDLRLMPASGLRDLGDPALTDPDGSPADLGAWGGPDALPDGALTADGDADGLPDAWELVAGLAPWVDDAAGDIDGDGLTEADELLWGASPTRADSDGDGVDDGQEVAEGTDPAWAGDRAPLPWLRLPRAAVVGAPVSLDGGLGIDPDSASVAVAWSVVGPLGSTAAPAAPAATVTTLTPDRPGTWRVSLTWDDGDTSVTTSADLEVVSGLRVPEDVGSVQEAVDAAVGSVTVLVAPGSWTGSVLLSGVDLTVVGLGASAADTVLMGDGGPTIAVTAGESLTLRNLTVTGGSAINGGGLWCIPPAVGAGAGRARITLEGVRVVGNGASGAGGGVFASGCELRGEDLVVADNTAAQEGGGLFLRDTSAVVRGLVVAGNASAVEGGGLWFEQRGATSPELRDVVFQGNTAPLLPALSWEGANASDAIGLLDGVVIADHDGGAGAVVGVSKGTLQIAHAVLAYNEGNGLLSATSTGTLRAIGLGTWSNAGAVLGAGVAVPWHFVNADPRPFLWSDDGDWTNDLWRWRVGSPMRDAGRHDHPDEDGSPRDLGLGGPGACIDRWDLDGDGLTDGWERHFGVSSPSADADGDGASNLAEHDAGTDPLVAD